MKKYILSIDQGTTSSRVVLFDIKFNLVDVVQKDTKQYFPDDGWVEHDATEIWQNVYSLIVKILKKNGLKSIQILSIGITNQRETTVIWNKITGKPVYRAIVWQDRRTAKICEKLIKKGYQKKIQKITGLLLDPYFSATKIKWILDKIKKVKKLINKNNLLFGTIDSWLLWNLTSKKSHLTDITNASRTMLYDIKNEKWSNEILKILNIPKSILPRVVPNKYNFGDTKLFGSNIKITGMIGDQQASALGHCCINQGQLKSTYGTGCFVIMNIGKKFKLSKNKLLTTIAFKINNKKMYCFEGSIFVAGSAIQWLRDKLKFITYPSESSKLYNQANVNEKIIFVTALTGLGAPYWDSNVRGAIFGLTRNTSIADIVKATLQSIVYQTYDLVQCMEKDSNISIKKLKVDGGMANNNNFIQFLSDILQIEIIRPRNIETSSLGAAYLAGMSSGLINNIEEVGKFQKKISKFNYKITKKTRKYLIKNWHNTLRKLLN